MSATAIVMERHNTALILRAIFRLNIFIPSVSKTTTVIGGMMIIGAKSVLYATNIQNNVITK